MLQHRPAQIQSAALGALPRDRQSTETSALLGMQLAGVEMESVGLRGAKRQASDLHGSLMTSPFRVDLAPTPAAHVTIRRQF